MAYTQPVYKTFRIFASQRSLKQRQISCNTSNYRRTQICQVLYPHQLNWLTDTMGRMHSDAQFAGSSSVPAHVEMMGFLGIGQVMRKRVSEN